MKNFLNASQYFKQLGALFAVSSFMGLGISCSGSDSETSSTDSATVESSMIITNGIDTSNGGERLKVQEQKIQIQSESGDLSLFSDFVDLTVIGELSAPQASVEIVAGQVAYAEGVAFVSYMSLGEEHAGAIDVVDVSSLTNPLLLSSVVSEDHDINTVSILNTDLWLAGARASFNQHSAFAVGLKWINNQLQMDTSEIEIPSFAGTDIHQSSSQIFVTSGDQGGLTLFDREPFVQNSYHSFFDARSVFQKGDKVYIETAQPGKLATLDLGSGNVISNVTIGDGNTNMTPQDKSHFYVGEHTAVMALSDQGFAVVCLADGSVLDHVNAFPGENVDLSPNYSLQVAVKGNYVYSASGGNGIQIYNLGENWDSSECNELDIERVGRFTFSDNAPATHITIEEDNMFVSAGKYGLKIIKIVDSEQCSQDEGCLLQQIAQKCDVLEDRVSATIEITLDDKKDCQWGQNGNLPKKNAYITAREVSSAPLNLPEGAILCNVDRIEAQAKVKADDWLFVNWNGRVLASNQATTTELDKVGSFYSYDWDKLKGLKNVEQNFCYTSGACSEIKHDKYADLNISLSEAWAQKLSASLILGSQNSNHEISGIVMGDDDNGDCELRSQEGDKKIDLEIDVQYVLETE